MTELTPKVLLLLAIVCAGVGAVDAAVRSAWDLLLIFAAIAILLMTMWIRQRLHRVDVTLRPDLAHWVEDRAESGGEPFDDVLDRAVAMVKHGIAPDDQPG